MTLAAARPAGLRLWWLAVRPKTLTISISPVLVGASLAWAESGRFDAVTAAVALLAAVLIQAGTNLHNDAADFERGGDKPTRLGPRRVTAQGWASPLQVYRAAWLCFAGAAAGGAFLVLVGGWPILALGVLSIIAGYAYTGGPRPIAYTPLGEVFVFLFFGLGAVCGTYWLMAGTLSTAAVLAGAAVGLLAAAVLLVNNVRDRDNDARAGRRTLAVLVGPAPARAVYALLVLAPFVLLVPVQGLLAQNVWAPLAALPLAGWLAGRFRFLATGPGFNAALARTALLQVLFAVLFSVGLIV